MEIIIAILVISFVLVLWCSIENHIFTVHKYTVVDKKIPETFDDVKIMYIADFHNSAYGKENQRLKQKIMQCDPDYVMIGGDLLSKPDADFVNAIDLLAFLAKRYPVYFANGNHETKMKEFPEQYHCLYQDFVTMAKGLQVTFLNNASIPLRRKGEQGEEQIYLHGLELPLSYFRRTSKIELEEKNVRKYLGKCAKKEYHILLAHSPNYFEAYDEWGADLVLSGHNHGGMARIPLIGGVLSTEARLFPKYSKGLYQGEYAKMIVSAGMGSHTIKVRFFNPPELVLVTLKADNS